MNGHRAELVSAIDDSIRATAALRRAIAPLTPQDSTHRWLDTVLRDYIDALAAIRDLWRQPVQ